jgi:hypothetical protein
MKSDKRNLSLNLSAENILKIEKASLYSLFASCLSKIGEGAAESALSITHLPAKTWNTISTYYESNKAEISVSIAEATIMCSPFANAYAACSFILMAKKYSLEIEKISSYLVSIVYDVQFRDTEFNKFKSKIEGSYSQLVENFTSFFNKITPQHIVPVICKMIGQIGFDVVLGVITGSIVAQVAIYALKLKRLESYLSLVNKYYAKWGDLMKFFDSKPAYKRIYQCVGLLV